MTLFYSKKSQRPERKTFQVKLETRQITWSRGADKIEGASKCAPLPGARRARGGGGGLRPAPALLGPPLKRDLGKLSGFTPHTLWAPPPPRPGWSPGAGGIRVLSHLTGHPLPQPGGRVPGSLPRGLKILAGWRPARPASGPPQPGSGVGRGDGSRGSVPPASPRTGARPDARPFSKKSSLRETVGLLPGLILGTEPLGFLGRT